MLYQCTNYINNPGCRSTRDIHLVLEYLIKVRTYAVVHTILPEKTVTISYFKSEMQFVGNLDFLCLYSRNVNQETTNAAIVFEIKIRCSNVTGLLNTGQQDNTDWCTVKHCNDTHSINKNHKERKSQFKYILFRVIQRSHFMSQLIVIQDIKSVYITI